jgi:hypothetical protein
MTPLAITDKCVCAVFDRLRIAGWPVTVEPPPITNRPLASPKRCFQQRQQLDGPAVHHRIPPRELPSDVIA